MHLHLNRTIVCFALLLMSFACVSCSKDDPEITHYQLEGTWQLYRTYVGQTDSIYELSADNEIIFTPKFYWRYMDASLSDSGSYTLTDISDEKDIFSAKMTFNVHEYKFLSLYGDTLSFTSPDFVASGEIYIRADKPAESE
ncbi:immunoglobulin domain-containing protein [Arachidicoccus terrestris]|uniref:immunoglobulin domain-containing protein n=1 Tax=Arachidicoccus terrestris TaxID=2875539 RepID=UPI001CC49F4C|nr:immunoglobulin domain-containing protein [Arachidicoccus terrestris]UAY56796.1 immunoglobulin domain-containing protein [Arachidicoccus terrestris]